MARIAWVFTDPTDASTYEFPINPNADGSLQYEKQINYKNTTAPDGKTLIYEGLDQPKATSFSGTILTEDQYNAMVLWFNKRHQIQLVDDLGRIFMIYITGFKPQRKLSRTYPWRHDYTVDYTIVDWSVVI